jgi:hypothetical protein
MSYAMANFERLGECVRLVVQGHLTANIIRAHVQAIVVMQ